MSFAKSEHMFSIGSLHCSDDTSVISCGDVALLQHDEADPRYSLLPGYYGGARYEKRLPDAEKVFVVDFFAGCGGASFGFASTRQSGLAFEILAGIDIDAHALKTYSQNVGARTLLEDVRNLAQNPGRLKELIPELQLDNSRPLVFIGCPPCQGFSAHRKKDERVDQRNDLIISFAILCNAYKPDFFFIENVPEMLTGRYASNYAEARRSLSDKYNINEAVVDMSKYGLPQRRRRAIVLGALGKQIPMPKEVFGAHESRTVRDAIGHLRSINAGETDPYDEQHRSPAHVNRILERIRLTPADGGDRRTLATTSQLACHRSLDSSVTPGFTDVYGRLRWDRPSVTITAKSSTPSCGRFLHPEQHRNITVREAAILQGFPQCFKFSGPFVHRYRQVGEALPPLFASFIASQLLSSIKPLRSKLPKSLCTNSQKRPKFRFNVKLPQLIDLFCGAGGLSLGFQAAGFRSLRAFDADGDAINSYNQNVAETAVQADINSPTFAKMLSGVSKGQRYIIVAGPPCQGFSQQRRGADSDTRNDLFLRIASLAESLATAPEAVIVENVAYLDAPRGRHVLAEYTSRMKRLGYQLHKFELNSADFAVAQQRRRIVIVAVPRSSNVPLTKPSGLTAERFITVGEAIGDLLSSDFEHDAMHVPSVEGELNRRRISFVDMGSGRLSIPPDLQLKCHTRYGGHLDVYGRLDWFAQARTVTGGFDSFTRGEFAHPFHNRSITFREAARLQGFPDWFFFSGNRRSIRQQIGNAVPPPLAYAIARSLIPVINGTSC